jgi:hypothetical protein
MPVKQDIECDETGEGTADGTDNVELDESAVEVPEPESTPPSAGEIAL